MNYEWLSKLKPGDRVVIERGQYGRNDCYLDIVKRVTKTQIATINGRYKKRDGDSIPYLRYGTNKIKERCTEERAAELNEREKRKWLMANIEQLIKLSRLERLSVEQIETINEWLSK
ncbi:MAG: hypothetical protein KDK05_15685 [Candidatus Competibacteraceae bacterium]|nr:hypothetical protein [Candidatus Competibacteraceae bacterium]